MSPPSDDATTQSYEEMEVFSRSSGQHVATAVSFPTVSPTVCGVMSHTTPSLGYTLGLNTSISLSPTLSAALASLSSMSQGSVVMPTSTHHINLDQSEPRIQSTVVLLDNPPDTHTIGGMLGSSFSESTGLVDDDQDVFSSGVTSSL